jgi:predicted nucleic acid-binding protein
MERKSKVRAADALHLAVAEERGSTLCTLDEEQAKAGTQGGVATLLL